MTYFEKQYKDNCAIHSLNNALGREAVKEEDVINTAKKRTEAYIFAYGDMLTKYIYTGKESMYTAEAVWQTALESGDIKEKPKEVEEDIDPKKPHVMLGIRHDGSFHSIAVRDGMIFDSVEEGPIEYSIPNVRKRFNYLLGAYEIIDGKSSLPESSVDS